MDIKIIYNDHHNKINIDCDKEIGYIQENILKMYNLIIYNIEYTKIKIENKEFILGIDDLEFKNKLNDFLNDNNYEEIECIEIIERKRDENGNVIKENLIIDKFNSWFQEKESTEYVENFNNRLRNIQEFNNRILNVDNIFSSNNINILSRRLVQTPSHTNNNQENQNNNIENQNNINDDENILINNENNNTVVDDQDNNENAVNGSENNNENNHLNENLENIDENINRNLDSIQQNVNTFLEDLLNDDNISNLNNNDFLNIINNNIQNRINNLNNNNNNFNNIIDIQLNNNENNINNSHQSINNEEINNEENNNEEINNEENNNEEINNEVNTNEETNNSTNLNNQDFNSILNQNLRNTFSDLFNEINNDIRNNSSNIINDHFLDNLINNHNNRLSSFNLHNQFQNNVNIPQNEDVIIALTDEEFNEIKEIKYSELNENCTKCNICLESFTESSKMLILKCGHVFDYNCIENWLKNHSNKCPVCREEIAKGHPINL